jgi:tetratricopeptide (TPR) repeat protein
MYLYYVNMRQIVLYKCILFLLLSLLGSMLVNESALAVGSFRPSHEELAQLPPYCKGREKKGGDPASQRRWGSVFGAHYGRMHHYCDALLHINRANNSFGDDKQRGAFLRTADDNLNYMLKFMSQNPDPGFVLAPEIMNQKGKVVAWRGQKSEAVTWYLKAIEIKPDYIPAYNSLVDYWVDIGNKDEALKYLNRGLAIKPESRSLLRRKKGLQ